MSNAKEKIKEIATKEQKDAMKEMLRIHSRERLDMFPYTDSAKSEVDMFPRTDVLK